MRKLDASDQCENCFIRLLPGRTVVVNQSITVYASKGSDRYIYCGVRYDRKINVTYKWYFKNQLIERTNARYLYGRWGRLAINGVYERDDGIYRCESTSGVGHYSTTVEVVVQGRLRFTPHSFGKYWIAHLWIKYVNFEVRYYEMIFSILLNSLNTELLCVQFSSFIEQISLFIKLVGYGFLRFIK